MDWPKRLGILITLALVLGLVVVAGPLTCAARKPHYVVDGQTISFAESPTSRAVSVPPGTDFDAISALIDGLASLEPSGSLERHNIVFLRQLPDGNSRQLEEAVERVADALRGRESPVYRNDDIDLVLINEFIVQFEESSDEEQARLLLNEYGARIKERTQYFEDRYTIEFSWFGDRGAREVFRVLSELNEEASIVVAEPNFVLMYPTDSYRTAAVGAALDALQGSDPFACPAASSSLPNDLYFCHQWALLNDADPTIDIDAVAAWSKSTGAGVTIAVLDFGVAPHADLPMGTALKAALDMVPTSENVSQNPNPWDSHGTLVAGIAAARFKDGIGIAGVAPEATVLPVRIGYSSSLGAVQSQVAWIQAGVQATLLAGAQVLLSSMQWDGSSPLLTQALTNAADDVILVFASGNGGGGVDYPAKLAASTSVLAVSASTKLDKSVISANNGPEVTVAAPGIGLWATDIPGAPGASGTSGPSSGDYYPNFDGTSGATPFVAGVAALLRASYAGASPAEIKAWIDLGADKRGSIKPGFLFGRLNASGAFAAADETVLQLSVAFPTQRLGKGEQKQVLAVVKKGGVLQPNVPVTFTSNNSSWLTVETPQPVTTDANGQAAVQVKGQTRFSRTAVVSATASGQTATAPVKVPVSPIWVTVWTLVCVAVVVHRRGSRMWIARPSTRRSLGAVTVIVAGLLLLDVRYSGWVEWIWEPLTDATVTLVAVLLKSYGLAVSQAGATLQSPEGFAYEITHRCAGFWPIVLFCAFHLAATRPGDKRLRSLVFGIGLLLVLNLVRLIHLFLLGVQAPSLFAIMHDLVWPFVTIMVMLGFCLVFSEPCKISVRQSGVPVQGA